MIGRSTGSSGRVASVVTAMAGIVGVCVWIASSPLASASGSRVTSAGSEVTCSAPSDPDEPPCNPALADSPWGASHRNSYAQASSSFPGPVTDQAERRHTSVPGVPIQLQFSAPYDDGGLAVWGSLVNTLDNRAVIKLDHETGQLIDLYLPAEREAAPPPSEVGGITGAYNLLDRDGRFIVGRQRSLEVYEDAIPGDRFSPIVLAKRLALPDRAFCRADDVIAGVTMTYDSYVAFVTEQGVVGVVPRDPAQMVDAEVTTYSLNGEGCQDPAVPTDELELVSNSLAADEDGGLYVVTSSHMHRLDWNRDTRTLGSAWSAPYESTGGGSAIRLGAGSGSTPTLMGTTQDDDRFVVITDAQDLMHVVLFWRGDIPADWQAISPGTDRRVACRAPVDFGDPTAVRSLSEQSVLVSGYAAVLVSNRLADESAFAGLAPDVANALAALEGGNPAQAPRGMERIDWDPDTRMCRVVWANSQVSIPNGIPTMSRPTALVYGIGQRDGTWGVQGIDFSSGEARLWIPGRNEPCTDEGLAGVAADQRQALDAVLARLPNSCENSFYAATEVGPDGTIYTGTFLGVSSYRPTPGPNDASGNRTAGIDRTLVVAIIGALLVIFAAIALLFAGFRRRRHS
jgi:hypothetical protein